MKIYPEIKQTGGNFEVSIHIKTATSQQRYLYGRYSDLDSARKCAEKFERALITCTLKLLGGILP